MQDKKIIYKLQGARYKFKNTKTRDKMYLVFGR